MLMRRWTPPSQLPTSALDNSPSSQRICLRWFKLFISALIAGALISFCVIYTLQKDNLFDEEYHHQQRDEHEREQRLIFDTYIEDVSNTLLQVTEKDKYRHIQTKTLLILRNLDVQRKKEIILFLYERNLLQNNQLNLDGADFNHVQLTCPHDFHGLHLSKVHWSDGILINCRLTSANFNQANLRNMRFMNCTLYNVSFDGTNLEQSQFIQTSIRNVDFTGASLIQADFIQADIVQGNYFINADLYQANLTIDQLEGKKFSIIPHDFRHARYPNGSFGMINSTENLLTHENTDMKCHMNQSTSWKIIKGNLSFATEDISTNNTHWENCLLSTSIETLVSQNINLHSYSLLIDTNNAAFSFNAFASCNQSYFEIHMYRADEIVHAWKYYTESIEIDRNKTMYQYGEEKYHLPIHTQRLEVYFGINIFERNRTCYFNNITLTIHQYQTQ